MVPFNARVVSLPETKDPRVVSKLVDPKTEANNKFKSFESLERRTYFNYFDIGFPESIIEIITHMGDLFDITKLYEISLDSGSKLNEDFFVATTVGESEFKVRVYFHFNNKEDLERRRVVVRFAVKEQNYFVKTVEELKRKTQRRVGSMGGGQRRSLDVSIEKDAEEQGLGNLAGHKMMKESFEKEIFIQTDEEAKREARAEFWGVVFLLLIAVVYIVSLVRFTMSLFLDNSYYISYGLSSLTYVQFITKLSLMNLHFSPATLAFLDQVYRADLANLITMRSESSEMRGGVSGKFREYGVPVLVLNSIPISLFLMVLSLVFYLVGSVLEKKERQKKKATILKKISMILVGLKSIDVIFYSLFSLTKSKLSIDIFLSLFGLIYAIIATIAAHYSAWRTKIARIDVNVSCLKKAISFVCSFIEPIRIILYCFAFVLASNESLKLGDFFVGCQFISLVCGLVFNCCLNKVVFRSSVLCFFRELTLLILGVLLNTMNDNSFTWTSDKLWRVTFWIMFLYFTSVIISVGVPEFSDFRKFIKQNHRIQVQGEIEEEDDQQEQNQTEGQEVRQDEEQDQEEEKEAEDEDQNDQGVRLKPDSERRALKGQNRIIPARI